jgi:hypothetical protein
MALSKRQRDLYKLYNTATSKRVHINKFRFKLRKYGLHIFKVAVFLQTVTWFPHLYKQYKCHSLPERVLLLNERPCVSGADLEADYPVWHFPQFIFFPRSGGHEKDRVQLRDALSF